MCHLYVTEFQLSVSWMVMLVGFDDNYSLATFGGQEIHNIRDLILEIQGCTTNISGNYLLGRSR